MARPETAESAPPSPMLLAAMKLGEATLAMTDDKALSVFTATLDPAVAEAMRVLIGSESDITIVGNEVTIPRGWHYKKSERLNFQT